MSRTGVGCRVLIDGKQLDDGCFDWGAIPPVYSNYVETRRNRIINPGPALNTGWAAIDTATPTGTLDFTTGHARLTTNAGGVTTATVPRMQVVGVAGATPVTAGETMTIRCEVKHSRGKNMEVRIWFMTAAGANVSYAAVVIAATPDWTPATWTGLVPATATLVGYQVISPSSAAAPSQAGDVLEARNFTTAVLPYFDGRTPAVGPTRYRWLGAADASASVEEIAQSTEPGPTPDDRIPQGVSAESGLSVQWGRTTTADQPRASACTFRVVDDPGGVTVLQTINIGSRVDVYADAEISGGVGVTAFDDPGFEAGLRATVSNARAERSSTVHDTGSYSAAVSAIDSAAASWIRFPPGTLQAPGTNPAAWAHLPATQPGETWTIRVRLRIPQAMTARLRPVFYDGPYSAAATVGTASVTAVSAGTAFQTVSVTFSPGTTAQWVGFQLDLGGGVTWAGIGPTPDWASAGAATWADYGIVYVDNVEVLPPAGGTGVTVQVFSGRITDLEGYYDEDWSAPALAVTASDFLADLGNRYIGDDPWPVQTVATRVPRILALAAIPGESGVSIDIASTLGGVNLTAVDIDSQASAGLLTDIAQSVDGVLWSATHPVIGPYIRLEDPAQRIALYQLALAGGKITIVPIDFTSVENPPPALSACDMLRDPVTFVMTVSDIATRVDAVWMEQPVAPDTETTERHYKVVNDSRELAYGTRAVSIQTDLTTSTDAARVAENLIARLGAAWRIEGLEFNDADVEIPDAAAAKSLVTLLNGVTRGGQALLITDLDAWSPVGANAPVYLEGGTYGFVNGGWSLSLIVSRASGFGQSASWDDIPNDAAWIWDAWEPSVTWDDLRGVRGP